MVTKADTFANTKCMCVSYN